MALVCVLLAVMCLGLAAAWKRKADEAECWRELAEEGTSAAAPCR